MIDLRHVQTTSPMASEGGKQRFPTERIGRSPGAGSRRMITAPENEGFAPHLVGRGDGVQRKGRGRPNRLLPFLWRRDVKGGPAAEAPLCAARAGHSNDFESPAGLSTSLLHEGESQKKVTRAKPGRRKRICSIQRNKGALRAGPLPEAFFNTANRTFCPGAFRSPLVTLRTAYPVEFNPE